MKQHVLSILIAAHLIACGGSDSTPSSTSKGSETSSSSEKSVRLDTRKIDYIAIKVDGEWQQLIEKENLTFNTDDNVFEFAFLCIEHDTSPNHYRYVYDVIDLSSRQSNDPLDFNFSCISPLETRTVHINNATSGFRLTDATADNINLTSTHSNHEDTIFSFTVPSHRESFDLIAVGKKNDDGTYYGHRNNSLNLQDGESYSIDFYNESSAQLIEFTPELSEGFYYSLSYTTKSGIHLYLPDINETSWFILPESLSLTDKEENYRETWNKLTEGYFMAYSLISSQPGASNRLMNDTAILPSSLSNASLNRSSLLANIPAIPAVFHDYKYQTTQTNLYSQDYRITYSIAKIGTKISDSDITLPFLDFNSLPNFNNLAPTLSEDELLSANGYIIQYKDLDNIYTSGKEHIFYDFGISIN